MQNRIASIHDVFSATFVVPRAVELIHLSLSAQRLPKPATIDLIEVRRLVYSSRNPKRACWHQPRWLGGQVCQDLDIGDGIGKREPISAPHLQRPKHFQLFAIGLRKTKLPLTGPDVRDQEVVRDASNEFIHGWLVVQARGEPRKISPSHNTAIEQADKTLCFFAQGDTGLHQQTAVSGHAGRESAIMHEWRRSPGESGEFNHAAMRLARYSSSQPAVLRRSRMESLPGAFLVRL